MFRPRLILLWQQNGRYAAVGFGNHPEARCLSVARLLVWARNAKEAACWDCLSSYIYGAGGLWPVAGCWLLVAGRWWPVDH